MSTGHRMMRDGFAMLPVAELIARIEAERIAERTAWPTAVDLARACMPRRPIQRSYVRRKLSTRPHSLTGAPKSPVIDFETSGSREVAAPIVADRHDDPPWERHHVRV
jgi:hypothetical protein